MTSRYLRILAVSGGLFVAAAPSFATEAPPALIQAQATATKASLEPGRLTQPLTDDAEVLSPAERSEIESAIQQVSQTQGKSVRVVFLRSFGQYTPSEWVDKAVAANGSNTAVVAISPDERQYNVGGGEEWTQSEIDRMNEAAYAQLSQMNWSSAALNAVNAVAGGSSSSGDGAGWLAGGLGVAALAGGGVYAATRKGSKKQQAKQIESAKALDPADTDSLGRLPTPTLEELARDALVSADDSITQGKQELELATSEFGADRVRPFTSAMNKATATLQRAFATHQQLYDAIPETEPGERSGGYNPARGAKVIEFARNFLDEAASLAGTGVPAGQGIPSPGAGRRTGSIPRAMQAVQKPEKVRWRPPDGLTSHGSSRSEPFQLLDRTPRAVSSAFSAVSRATSPGR